MSIFTGIPGEEQTEEITDWREMRKTVRDLDMVNLATYLGCEWDKHKKCIICPKHETGKIDRHPSARVYHDHIFCYSCQKHYSPVDLVMAMLDVDFREAMLWFEANIPNLTHLPVPNIHRDTQEYRGPVPSDIVYYWHRLLTGDRRHWLHKRLITDQTIDFMKLGYRPDYNAITVPFWRGLPGDSEIDIVQYRWLENKIRWTGMTGHNRPSLLNPYCVGKHSVVLLFGTFDAILAVQDGIAALSINGATTFMSNEENIARLRSLVQGCHVYVIPDRSDVEAAPAHRLAHALHGDVRHFPSTMTGKDYTDFRMEGGTPSQFFREVLMIGEGFIKPEDDEFFGDLLYNISVGGWNGAEGIALALEYTYPVAAVVNQHIQLRMQFDPFPGLTHEQWDQLRATITDKLDWTSLKAWIYDGCMLGHANQGGF
jgi:hypothetical protein